MVPTYRVPLAATGVLITASSKRIVLRTFNSLPAARTVKSPRRVPT